MGMFLPLDISVRIKQFMAAKVDFPFLGKDELWLYSTYLAKTMELLENLRSMRQATRQRGLSSK